MEHDNPDSIFLNPAYLEKIENPKPCTYEDWKVLLTQNPDMPDYLKDCIEEQMSDPTRQCNSKLFGFLKDWVEHPEKSRIYRDTFLFPTTNQIMAPHEDEDYRGWKVEIPLFILDF